MTTPPLAQAAPAAARHPGRWSLAVDSLTRPYRVTLPMVVLVSLVPLYVFIPTLVAGRKLHAPELPLDALFPLRPAWSLVYGALYLFLIVLPILAIRQEEHIRRTVRAYLLVWIVAYGFFLAVPTVAPRPAEVVGGGFGGWGLRLLYGADPPANCFPSLHVAHSFVSALACWRLDRRLGLATLAAASLVGLSTLYTRQHYALDVLGGALLAGIAYAVFLRPYPRHATPELDRRAAPVVAVGLLAAIALGVAGAWVVYASGGGR